ncbi:MAG: sigma-70 family RNA polymerase sigma factor [Phycisphaerae bacterium]|nr:sigma-70 family RNA polymerase sigma factor [Phycisphaerae bacterium]MDW8261476.1 sigma-70 family RNA polymerase sigma factor [Phycisphaerales bacterium]
MAELAEADRYLLELIDRGQPEGWSQLVARYQGRLLAFARSRLNRKAEAEDLVQETFVAFLESLGKFDRRLSLETFLFTILRRRIIDALRGRQLKLCYLQETLQGDQTEQEDASSRIASDEMTASFYARRDEDARRFSAALADALDALVGRFREAENFRDLQIVEMLFYAQLRNKDVAALMKMDEKAIALIKHRCLNEIRDHIVAHARLGAADSQWLASPAWESAAATASMITEVWESQRPTCPKRSTIGRLMLGTLDGGWKKYVDFHVNTLGCRFCRANLEDLQKQTEEAPQALHDRVMHSTIGFFRK